MESTTKILKPVVNLKKTGKKIAKLINEKGFTVKELQHLFGFENPQAIYAWLDGKAVPKIDNLLILARLFNVDISEIVEYDLIEVSVECSEYAADCMNYKKSKTKKCCFMLTA